jgi:hypothetical protein
MVSTAGGEAPAAITQRAQKQIIRRNIFFIKYSPYNISLCPNRYSGNIKATFYQAYEKPYIHKSYQ